MQCPHCQKNVTLFLVKQAPTGKEQLCSHCGGGLKVTFSVPALLGCFVAAVVVTLLLYPMLGRVATVLAGSAAILLSLRLKPHGAAPSTQGV